MNFTDDELNELPLSQLLRLAVWHGVAYDELVASDGRYEWDMDTWLDSDPDPGGVCYACLAGAVLVGLNRAPEYVCFAASDWMARIDDIRFGVMVEKAPKAIPDLIESSYSGDLGRAPWETYLQAADMLQAEGL